jgi:hypothetical protein
MDFFNWLEKELNLVVGLIKAVVESPEVQVFKWVLAIVVAYYVGRLLIPTWRIIRLSLYEDLPWSVSRSLLDLLKLNPVTLNREKWYRAARVRVERELLQPRPNPPARHHALQGGDRYENEEKRYKEDLAGWKADLKEHIAKVSGSDDDPVVRVDDVSKIYARADKIRNYFGVLATDKSAHRYGVDRFVSKVKVRRGFIAPLHLLSGLLAETEEEWAPVIADYGRQVAQPMPEVTPDGGHAVPFGPREAELRLQRLQTFLFDCWLLWGPSIPLCTCEAWHGGRRVLQFGFGDENNSLALLFKNTPSVEDLRRFFSSESVLGDAPAIKVTGVTGVLQWGPSVDPTEVSPAQQSLADPDEDRLALVIDDLPLLAAGSVEEGAARYYSAYLWVMFAMCDDAGTPLYRSNRRWRGVLPFFEHANIAEGQAMALLKRQLVVKTLSSVLRLLHELPHLTLQFVCAIDESGCGCELLCPPPQGESLSTLIRKVIQKDDMFADLRPGGRLHARLRMTPVELDASGTVTNVWQEGNYSSCHLPDLVESYYDYLDNIASGGSAKTTDETDNPPQAPSWPPFPTEG